MTYKGVQCVQQEGISIPFSGCLHCAEVQTGPSLLGVHLSAGLQPTAPDDARPVTFVDFTQWGTCNSLKPGSENTLRLNSLRTTSVWSNFRADTSAGSDADSFAPCYCCCCCRLKPGQIWESRICRRWQSRIPRRRRIIRPGRNHHGDRSLRRFWRGQPNFVRKNIVAIPPVPTAPSDAEIGSMLAKISGRWLIDFLSNPASLQMIYIFIGLSPHLSLSLYIILYWYCLFNFKYQKKPSILGCLSGASPLEISKHPSWRSQAKQKIRIESRSVVDCPEATNDSWQSHLRSWMKLVWYRKTLIPPSYTV